MRPVLEVADVFRRHGDAFRRDRSPHLGRVERRVMAAIEACRTAALGGHVEQCGECNPIRPFIALIFKTLPTFDICCLP